jgi:hypothetical protein
MSRHRRNEGSTLTMLALPIRQLMTAGLTEAQSYTGLPHAASNADNNTAKTPSGTSAKTTLVVVAGAGICVSVHAQ